MIVFSLRVGLDCLLTHTTVALNRIEYSAARARIRLDLFARGKNWLRCQNGELHIITGFKDDRFVF